MARCTNCKRPVPDGAKFCGHCGKTMFWEPNEAQQPPFTQYNVHAYETEEQHRAAVNARTADVKPNCDLSVASFVMALLNPYFCLIAFIISIVALAKRQVRRKLAWAAFVISLLEILLIAAAVVVVLVVLPQQGIDISEYIPWLAQPE